MARSRVHRQWIGHLTAGQVGVQGDRWQTNRLAAVLVHPFHGRYPGYILSAYTGTLDRQGQLVMATPAEVDIVLGGRAGRGRSRTGVEKKGPSPSPAGKLLGIDPLEVLAPVKIALNGVDHLSRRLALMHLPIPIILTLVPILGESLVGFHGLPAR